MLNRASQYQKDGKSMRTFEKAIQTNHDENTYKAVPFKTKLTAFVHWIRYDLITSLVSMWGTPQYIHKNDLQVSDNDVVSAEYHDVPQYSALPCPALKAQQNFQVGHYSCRGFLSRMFLLGECMTGRQRRGFRDR